MPVSISSEELPGKRQVTCGDAGPRSATANRGHCFLAIHLLLLPGSSQHGLQPASHPQGLPSSQRSHTTHAFTYHRNCRGKAPQADTGHPRGTPCNARDTLPCLSQPSTNAQQKPAAHSPHRCLADLQLKKSLYSPLHFSSTLCQPFRGSGRCSGDGVLINQKL